jgi:hypothetical protein
VSTAFCVQALALWNDGGIDRDALI